MFFKFVVKSATKNEIKAALLWNAEQQGADLSKSRADALADKFKRGEFDPDLARFLQHSDTTGEIACGFMANPFTFATNHDNAARRVGAAA